MQNDTVRCDTILGNYQEHLERMKSASTLSADLLNYTKNFGQMLKCTQDKKLLSELGYKAETKTRLLLDHALTSLNFLYDTGRMEKILKDFHKGAGDGQPNIKKALETAKEFIKQNHNDTDTGFLDEALRILESQQVSFQQGREAIQVSRSVKGQKLSQQAASLSSVPGETGRISSREFFSPTGRTFLPTAEIEFNDETCHHRKQIISDSELHSHDVYGKLLNTFAYLRDSAYKHARVMEDFGSPHIRGNGPLAIVIIVLAIVAAALIIAGATIEIGCATGAWSGTVCDVGWWLIGFGVVIGFAAVDCYIEGCVIILSLFVSIAV